MSDKFSQYDFIANIVPGIFALFLISTLNNNLASALFQNTITGSIVFFIVAYVTGVIIQLFSLIFVEIPIKLVFWRGKFYSCICLIKESGCLAESFRKKVLNFAKKELKISRNELSIFDSDKDFSLKATDLSHLIYKEIDAKTKNEKTAEKAHLHNNYYSLLRGLTLVFLVLFITLILLIFNNINYKSNLWYLVTFFAFMTVLLLYWATKDRGEQYVKGLFYSIIN